MQHDMLPSEMQLLPKASCGNEAQSCLATLQAGFTSLAHTDEDVEHTIQAAREVFAEL